MTRRSVEASFDPLVGDAYAFHVRWSSEVITLIAQILTAECGTTRCREVFLSGVACTFRCHTLVPSRPCSRSRQEVVIRREMRFDGDVTCYSMRGSLAVVGGGGRNTDLYCYRPKLDMEPSFIKMSGFSANLTIFHLKYSQPEMAMLVMRRDEDDVDMELVLIRCTSGTKFSVALGSTCNRLGVGLLCQLRGEGTK